MKFFILFMTLISSYSSLADAGLIGKWQSSCTKLIKRHSVISHMEISSGKLIVTQQLYSDGECKILSLELKSEATYQNKDSHFYWQPYNITIKILNSEVKNFYNLKEMCGLKNWELNQEQDVAGKFCDPNYMPSKGVMYADQFLVKTQSVLQFERFPDILENTSSDHRTLKTSLIFNRID